MKGRFTTMKLWFLGHCFWPTSTCDTPPLKKPSRDSECLFLFSNCVDDCIIERYIKKFDRGCKYGLVPGRHYPNFRCCAQPAGWIVFTRLEGDGKLSCSRIKSVALRAVVHGRVPFDRVYILLYYAGTLVLAGRCLLRRRHCCSDERW